MTLTEAPGARGIERRSSEMPDLARRASPWWRLVAASALVLVATAVVVGAWWAVTTETRVTTYRVVGTLAAIELDVGGADVEVAGGEGGVVAVRREDAFAFGGAPREERRVVAGVMRIAARCPEIVVGRCASAYRLTVPDNIEVDVATADGRVRITGLNASARVVTGSGSVTVDGFCGYTLHVTSEAGDVRAATACSADRLELRSASGDVRAAVPPGRYRIEAHSDRGSARVRGLLPADDASFAVQAISARGDVLVGAAP